MPMNPSPQPSREETIRSIEDKWALMPGTVTPALEAAYSAGEAARKEKDAALVCNYCANEASNPNADTYRDGNGHRFSRDQWKGLFAGTCRAAAIRKESLLREAGAETKEKV